MPELEQTTKLRFEWFVNVIGSVIITLMIQGWRIFISDNPLSVSQCFYLVISYTLFGALIDILVSYGISQTHRLLIYLLMFVSLLALAFGLESGEPEPEIRCVTKTNVQAQITIDGRVYECEYQP